MRCLSQKAQDAVRARVVAAVRGGMKRIDAARVFGVTRQSITRWMKMGNKELVSRRRGKQAGCGSRLGASQSREIRRLVTDRHPEQLKLPFALWTRDAVRQLISDRFGISVSRPTMSRYLKQWGLTPQKPVRRAVERNPEAVKRWLEHEYPAIRQQARREDAVILWGDETSARSDHAAGRSFSPRGKTPVIVSTGKRFKCNVISAISNRGELQFMTFRANFTQPMFPEFLRRLVRRAPQKIFLILDGHPVHRGAKVRRWLEDNHGRIRAFFLPPYCPELNPDELLNNDLKTNAVGRTTVFTAAELQANLRGYLRITQRAPHIVKNYFREKHVRYAAN
jgi:transposase